MSRSKKEIRQLFRERVLRRGGRRCEVCGVKGVDRQAASRAGTECVSLDAHHVTDRHRFTNGGYVPENGICLCDDCHAKAEHYHATGVAIVGYAPDDLYRMISSSFEEARRADAEAG